MDRLRDKLNNIDKYKIVTISYKKIDENNITYIKITDITDITNTQTPPENNICVFLEKENLDKYYICRLWSYQLDNFVCVDYIRKLNNHVPYSFNPDYDVINKLPMFRVLNYRHNVDLCYDKISYTPIIINSHNDNGLYTPYPDIFYGLVFKGALAVNETIITSFGKDINKLIEINKDNNEICCVVEIPLKADLLSNNKSDIMYYGYNPKNKIIQGLFITDEKNISETDIISYNPITMYEYYDGGILNA